MRKITFSILCLIMSMSVLSQSHFGDPFVIDQIDGEVYSLHTADFDGDGDQDIVAGFFVADQGVVWYENLDGLGTFSALKIIADDTNIPAKHRCIGAADVQTADVDNDNDQDVVVAFSFANLAWFENVNNGERFDVHSCDLEGDFRCISSADLDGDTDIDIIFTDRQLSWMENIDGTGNFSSEKIISSEYNGAVYTDLADLDNDGDPDVVAAKLTTGKLVWHENMDGNASFSDEKIISTYSPTRLVAADIDGDYAIDIISATDHNNIVWYQNLDGYGAFNLRKTIATNINTVRDLCAADMDCDGDVDIVAASQQSNKVVWYENTNGIGTFSIAQNIDLSLTQASAVHTADIDHDGDLDVLAASQSGKVMLYKNLTISTGIENELDFMLRGLQLFQNYPNPFNPSTMIRYQLSMNNDVKLAIYNMMGQKVATLVNGWQNAGEYSVQWYAEGLPAGIYVARLNAGAQVQKVNMILQK